MDFSFYRPEDQRLADMLPHVHLLDMNTDTLAKRTDIPHYPVWMPDGSYTFLHEAAIIEYKGTLFASWYNCPKLELQGHTPIRGSRSIDGGKTWSPVEVLMEDPAGKIIYCPPVYGICDGKLYMMVNQMVAPDHMHSLDLYVYHEDTERFEFVWSRPVPFKLNTNVYHLPNGKLMMPGRIAELDGFPNTPAVLISDSGKMDGEWRLVYIRPDGDLPDGEKLVHPEIAAMIEDGVIYMFCRDDLRQVPLVYLSRDMGENWEGPCASDVPFSSSKIYAGDLADGRHYAIGNLDEYRSRLAIFFTRPHESLFTEGFLLQDGYCESLRMGKRWHYPVCWESDGKLYVIYTVSIEEPHRGAVLSVIDLKTV